MSARSKLHNKPESGGSLADIVGQANTPERQIANIVSEWFYFRYFDYLQKRHPSYGPNLKYSAGSARDVVFLNWVFRLQSGQTPSSGSADSGPEIENALNTLDRDGELRRAIDLICTVKNAAITRFSLDGDKRVRYINPTSLEAIYALCKNKMEALGHSNTRNFTEEYMAARRHIETTADRLVWRTILDDAELRSIEEAVAQTDLDTEDVVALLRTCRSMGATALLCWEANARNVPASGIDKLVGVLREKNLSDSWGGMMGLICSKNCEADTLNDLASWLYQKETGAYLLKLVQRNANNASPATVQLAKMYYDEKESMKSL